MTTIEIIENNKLIAEFMGAIFKDNQAYIPNHAAQCYEKDCLAYHSSWDWLMTVVEKIEEIEPEVRVIIYEDEVEIWQKTAPKWTEIVNISADGSGKLDNTYKAVVEFIKWYNEDKL